MRRRNLGNRNETQIPSSASVGFSSLSKYLATAKNIVPIACVGLLTFVGLTKFHRYTYISSDDVHSGGGPSLGQTSVSVVNASHSPTATLFDPNFCNGAVSPPLSNDTYAASPGQLRVTSNSSQTSSKYVIFYPRAGMGNVIAGYASAAMYACLTGRELKIAPRSDRETKVFKCEEYYESGPGSICHNLEMDDDLVRRFKASKSVMRGPEAWATPHCANNKKHFEHFLCDDGTGSEEFVPINSCQYYGDLFHYNPHFKHRLSRNPYRDLIRGRLKPSEKVRSKMVPKEPVYDVCIHIRFKMELTAEGITQSLGKDWVSSLDKCVQNIYETSNKDLNKDILLFTMHQDVRDALKQTFEKDGLHSLHFASEDITLGGKQGHSSDPYQGFADMFSMATNCLNILASDEASTFFLISANLMNNTRVFPGSRWKEDGCMPGTELLELKPQGDYWKDKDVCNIRNIKCQS